MVNLPRAPRYSWIVSQEHFLPTGYEPSEVHPDLRENSMVLKHEQQLRSWITRKLGSAREHADRHLIQRLEQFPPGIVPRRWVLRDDNQQHYHGVVRLSEGPCYIEFHWKPDRQGQEQLVGRFRLNLPELLAADHVRFEREMEKGDDIRVRFYRGSGGAVYLQSRSDRPGLRIGQITLAGQA